MTVSSPNRPKFNETSNTEVLDPDQDPSLHPELVLDEEASYETSLETEASDQWEDEYVSEEDPLGNGEAGASYTPGSVRDQLTDLAHRGVFSQQVYFGYITRLNRAESLSGSKQQALLSQIMGELSSKYDVQVQPSDPLLGDLGEMEADSQNSSVTEEIQQFITQVQKNEKLSEGNRKQLITEAEKLLVEAEGIEAGSEAEYTLEEKVSQLTEQLTQFEAMPSNVSDMAKRFHRTEAEVMAIADKNGLDMANLPEPPTAEVFNFLAELDSRLEKAYEAAKAGPGKKEAMDQEMVQRAQKSSNNNASSTTNSTPDKVDWDSFWYLDAARDYKDEGTRQFILQPYKKVTRMLAQHLKSLYPEVKIKTKGQNDIESVDVIQFGDQEIDVLSNSTGEFQTAVAGADMPPGPPPLVTLLYDWEGSGDWEDSTFHRNYLQQLQASGYPTSAYDSPLL